MIRRQPDPDAAARVERLAAAFRAEQTRATERLHPESLLMLRKLVALHGADRLIAAIREISIAG